MVRVFVKLGPPSESSFFKPLGLLSECHRRIERFLSDMTRVAAKAGGELDDDERAALAGAVRYFSEAAPRHTADEEESLFPRLRALDGERIKQAMRELRRLEDDHQRADACHAEANALARRWLETGGLAAAESQRLNEVLAELGALYRDHIAVEDSSVFPAAQAALAPNELEAIGREMAARRGLDFDRVVGQHSTGGNP